MASRIRFFAKDGTPVAVVSPPAQRSWLLNEFGKATILISKLSPKLRRDFIEHGNYVLIEHDVLPPWGGMIDPPRSWGSDAITITAYSGEYIFTTRSGSFNRPLAGSAGQIFLQLLNAANAEGNTRIVAGDIDVAGPGRSEEFNSETMYDAIAQLVEGSGNDWFVEPAVDPNNRIYFKANWRQRLGSQQQLLLQEGQNIERTDNPLEEQGDIVNDILGFGEGATQDVRPSVHMRDPDSIARYGLRKVTRFYFGAKELSTLQACVAADLARCRQPRNTLTVSALNAGDTFASLERGNTLPVLMHSDGFRADGLGMDTFARILGMAYDETRDKVNLVLDEEL